MATYKEAGVDLNAADEFEEMIRERVSRAWPEMGKEIGGFAGGGPIPREAKLVKGSTDGTGTKIILAALLGEFDGIGQDAVAMGAVDMYVSGSMPLYALDTLKVGRLKPFVHIKIIESVIDACIVAGCRLIGGETAELPDMFRYRWMVDLDASVIGFPLPELTFMPVKPGQKVYGWPSHGPAANGFSLLRKTFGLRANLSVTRKRLREYVPELRATLAHALLKPTPIWIPEIEGERERGVKFAGHAHITGGGMPGNIPRILPLSCKVVIDRSKWLRPDIFRFTQERGRILQDEMDRVFNQGIQVVSIVASGRAGLEGSDACLIGEVERRKGNEPQAELMGVYRDE